jgi:hypothetical protein
MTVNDEGIVVEVHHEAASATVDTRGGNVTDLKAVARAPRLGIAGRTRIIVLAHRKPLYATWKPVPVSRQ